MKIARVFLKQTNKRIDRAYDYRVPDTLADQVVPGVRVAVPFAQGHRVVEGFVISVGGDSKYTNKLRDVLQVIDAQPVVDEVHRKLCLWLVKIYDCLFYDALALFTQPVRVSRETNEKGEISFRPYHKTEKIFRITQTGKTAKTKGKKMARILELLKSGPMSASELNAALQHASDSRKRLQEKGWIESVEGSQSQKAAAEILPLSCDRHVFQSIQENLSNAGTQPVFFYQKDDDLRFDLFLQAAVEVVHHGKSVLLIEPEINLLKKNAGRFKSIFGELGAVYHSNLKISERYRVFHQIQTESVKVVLGTRTAVFLPFKNIGLIGVDETGNGQYISDSEPHYKLPDVAAQLAKICSAQMLISDPIPSVTLKWRMSKNQIVQATAPSDFSPVGIIDMKREMQRGNLGIFSHLLEEEMNSALNRKQQVVLLHNRLGYQHAVFCRACGETVKCPVCGRPMKTDQTGILICTTCGEKRPFPKTCPSCGSNHIKGMGVGLDQVVEMIQEKWRGHRVVKIDAAAVRQKEFDELCGDIRKADIVVGTRSLVRGFPFDNVGCAAGVLIDQDIDGNAYHAAEQAYRLYRLFFEKTNAVCRYVQTYNEMHPVVEALHQSHDDPFYDDELKYRKSMGYPPFGHVFYFEIFGEDRAQIQKDSISLYHALQARFPQWSVYKPIFGEIRRENHQLEYRIMMKAPEIPPVSNGIRRMIWAGEFERLASKITVVIDPVLD